MDLSCPPASCYTPYLLTYSMGQSPSWEANHVNFAASQEIPRIYGTRKSLIVPTSARHLSLSWANSIQSPRPPPTSWRSILILSSHLRLGLPNGLFSSGSCYTSRPYNSIHITRKYGLLTQAWARLEPELKRNCTPYLHSFRYSVHCCTYSQERHIVLAVPPMSASFVVHRSLYNKHSVPTICSHIWHLSRPLANRDSSHPGLPTGSRRWWGRETTSSEWAVSFTLRPYSKSYQLHRTPAGGSTALGYGYFGVRNDTTQQSGQTPDKEVEIKNITVYVSGYTETDTTGMLSSPTVWRFSVAADIDSNSWDLLGRAS